MMYKLPNDFSFGLFFWQLFAMLHLASLLWAAVLLLKSNRETSVEKLVWLLSFIFIPCLTTVFYIFNYYTCKKRVLQ